MAGWLAGWLVRWLASRLADKQTGQAGQADGFLVPRTVLLVAPSLFSTSIALTLAPPRPHASSPLSRSTQLRSRSLPFSLPLHGLSLSLSRSGRTYR